MTDPSEALVPANRPSELAIPAPPSFGFSFAPPPAATEEPSLLWKTLTRHFRFLVICGLISAGIAYLVGTTFGKPTWQSETTLLYQPVPLTPQQQAVYHDAPNINTLSNMVCEAAVMDQLSREFGFVGSVDDFLAKNIRVNQPVGTQLISISLNWNDRDTAPKLVTRLADLFADFVVVNRKESILRRALTATQQALAVSKNEIARLTRQIQDLESQLIRTGKLDEIDADGSLAIRRGTLLDDIKRAENLLEEYYASRTKTIAEITRLEPLVRSGGIPAGQMRDLRYELDIVELRIKHANDKVVAAREEIRTLPIVLARGKLFAELSRAKDSEDQIQRLQSELIHANRPGGLPAKGLLEGMDARELTVKSPARVADNPTASTKKSIAIYTFFGLMGTAFGLALAYDYFRKPRVPANSDRRRGRRATDAAGPVRTQFVQVERRDGHTEKVTIAHVEHVESPRLSVRIDQWIKNADSSCGPLSALTIGQDGVVEEPKPRSPKEARHINDRIHQWLEKGSVDPPPPSSQG